MKAWCKGGICSATDSSLEQTFASLSLLKPSALGNVHWFFVLSTQAPAFRHISGPCLFPAWLTHSHAPKHLCSFTAELFKCWVSKHHGLHMYNASHTLRHFWEECRGHAISYLRHYFLWWNLRDWLEKLKERQSSNCKISRVRDDRSSAIFVERNWHSDKNLNVLLFWLVGIFFWLDVE